MSTESTAVQKVTQVVPFFMVSDMRASLGFYVDGLGFRMTDKWIDDGRLRWCWLELGGAALMLQEWKREGRDSRVPDGKVGVGVSLYFMCEDALAIYREITARGLTARRPFVGNRMWVTSVTDPDGYNIDFERPTDAAEETEYSESSPHQ